MPDPVVKITDLEVVFHARGIPRRAPFTAVNGVTLHVNEREIVGLVGESGSGKSTIGLALVGMVDITSGQAQVLGRDITELSRRRWRELRPMIQLVQQDPHAALDPRQTVGGGFRELRRRHPSRTQWITDEDLLARVELDASYIRRLPHELSGGQAQRVCIARALLLRPTVIVADEPTSALDVSVQAHILRLLLRLRDEENVSLLFISHDLAVVRAICDRVYVMRHAVIVEHGLTEDVLCAPDDPYTLALIDAIPGASVAVADVSSGRR